MGSHSEGVKAGRSTILLQNQDGEYSHMNETEKLSEVFQNTTGMLGENQPHDLQ